MPSMFDTFKASKDTKTVRVDTKDPTKTVQVRAGMSPK
jgi:hypothetical protein